MLAGPGPACHVPSLSPPVHMEHGGGRGEGVGYKGCRLHHVSQDFFLKTSSLCVDFLWAVPIFLVLWFIKCNGPAVPRIISPSWPGGADSL